MTNCIPTVIDLFDKKGCYLWIEYTGKKFPCHLITDMPGVEFEFYINFTAFVPKRSHETALLNKKSLDSITGGPDYSDYRSIFKLLDKPSKHSCD